MHAKSRRSSPALRKFVCATIWMILVAWFLWKCSPYYKDIAQIEGPEPAPDVVAVVPDEDKSATPDDNHNEGDNVEIGETEITVKTEPAKESEEKENRQAIDDKGDDHEPQVPVLVETDEERDARLRKEYETGYEELGLFSPSVSLFGNTLTHLIGQDERKLEFQATLRDWPNETSFSSDKPSTFDPYPLYNGPRWQLQGRSGFVSCMGPFEKELQHVSVFRGRPHDFPEPGLGSYDVFDIDSNLCFERETRLGPYGLSSYSRESDNWDDVDWGQLQNRCLKRNWRRFNHEGPPNNYVSSAYGQIEPNARPDDWSDRQPERRDKVEAQDVPRNEDDDFINWPDDGHWTKEPRTAILLRSFTGKEYNDNDKQNVRALVSELALHSGGEYRVYLLVHVKDGQHNLSNPDIYAEVLESSVPKEFRNMTILWNDALVQPMYPRLGGESAIVHYAQWFSLQKFIMDNREFDFVWNWEMDSRLTGHFYDLLSKISKFAKKQPRRGLWERNERYYIPKYHGDYDTTYRMNVEAASGNDTIWGAPALPFINPVGQIPPTAKPEDDDYVWGVGEDADLITLGPMFNPIDSGWVMADKVWEYRDSSHPSESLPRRTTIITQCRLSRRLLDIMHVENLRGNHVASEMTANTVALLHGLKAVYAPVPIHLDRAWNATSLNKWFNSGPKGVAGGKGSAMGWGREGRFQGSTWYYRALPPQRLYNNWMGYEDSSFGGPDWEEAHGRPCLPAMFLHPVKNVEPTKPGHSSDSKLPYS